MRPRIALPQNERKKTIRKETPSPRGGVRVIFFFFGMLGGGVVFTKDFSECIRLSRKVLIKIKPLIKHRTWNSTQ